MLSPTWDNSDTWISTLRHTVKEGRMFVVGVTAFVRGGEILAGPLTGEKGTVRAMLDLDLIAAGRRSFDPTGHYARPDILALTINTSGSNMADSFG